MMKLPQSLFLVAAATALVTSVQAGGHNTISVEPYLTAWCADQWPDQLGKKFTGYDIAAHMKYRDYKRIEPYLGDYCFQQFGELATYNKAETIQNLRENHVQIEPYFLEWGELQMRTPRVSQRINLERYIQEWCVRGQFKAIIPEKEKALANALANKVTMEPTFGKWCFDQFPSELASLDRNAEVNKLRTDHVPLENNLIVWAASVEGARLAARSSHHLNQTDAAIGAGVGFLIALVILIPVFAVAWCCCKRRQAAQDAAFQRSVQHAENQIHKEMEMADSPFNA